jgi:regulator of replication initiation timing
MAYKTHQQLLSEIEELQKQVERLLDENSSLWFMLDEFDKSNITNPEYFEKIQEVIENLRKARLMSHTKTEEA